MGILIITEFFIDINPTNSAILILLITIYSVEIYLIISMVLKNLYYLIFHLPKHIKLGVLILNILLTADIKY